jgi:hypothetical protein
MPSPARLPLIDALRGFAIAQMIVYHFIYDLTFFGWYGTVMARDPVWIAWRTAITTQFLLLVGLGLVLRAQWGNLVFGAICPALPEQSAKNQWHREVPSSNAVCFSRNLSRLTAPAQAVAQSGGEFVSAQYPTHPTGTGTRSGAAPARAPCPLRGPRSFATSP